MIMTKSFPDQEISQGQNSDLEVVARHAFSAIIAIALHEMTSKGPYGKYGLSVHVLACYEECRVLIDDFRFNSFVQQ